MRVSMASPLSASIVWIILIFLGVTTCTSAQSPNPPRDVTAEKHDSTSIRLRWRAPAPRGNNDGLNVIAYSLHIKATDGGMELQEVTQNTELIVRSLQPNTKYDFYVTAYNMMGASVHSKTITQVTDDDVPRAAPEPHVRLVDFTKLLVQWDPIPAYKARGEVAYKVIYRKKDSMEQLTVELEVPKAALEPHVRLVDSTKLLVQWDPISAYKARGEVVAYKVIYRKKGSMEQLAVELGPDVREYTIENFDSEQVYEVRVNVATRKGYAKLKDSDWPWHSQVTSNNSNVGLAEKPEMSVRVLNSTSVKVKWEEPRVNNLPAGEIIGYKLRIHRLHDDETPKLTIMVPEQKERVITELVADTWYEISVLAFTVMGDGDMAKDTLKTSRSV